jgi:hypothetical protein
MIRHPLKLLAAAKAQKRFAPVVRKALPLLPPIVGGTAMRRWDFDNDGAPFYLDPENNAWLKAWILIEKGSMTTGAAPASAEDGMRGPQANSSP